MPRNIPNILKCMVGVFSPAVGLYLGNLHALPAVSVLCLRQFVFKVTLSYIVSVRLILLQICLTPCDRKITRYQLLMAW
jgi:hypothetical protein